MARIPHGRGGPESHLAAEVKTGRKGFADGRGPRQTAPIGNTAKSKKKFDVVSAASPLSSAWSRDSVKGAGLVVLWSEVIPCMPLMPGQAFWWKTRTMVTFHQMSLKPWTPSSRWSWPGVGTTPRPGTITVPGWSKHTWTVAGAHITGVKTLYAGAYGVALGPP